jgi:beta-alanine--pyruvate transaminase
LEDGTEILDGVAGLWCVNAGHAQEHINTAIKTQVDKLDYASSFNTSHELPFEFSRKILELLPGRNFSQVFFTMCGSTAIETSMKIALAYHKANGNDKKVRYIYDLFRG